MISIGITFIIAVVCLWSAIRLIAAGTRRRKNRVRIGGAALAFFGIGLLGWAGSRILEKPSESSDKRVAAGVESWVKKLLAKPPTPSDRHGSMVPKPPAILPLDQFESYTLQRGRLVVLEFGAEWSGPCVRFGPKLEKIYGEFDDVATVARLNIDYARTLAKQQDVNEVPDLRFYQDGVQVGHLIGDVDEEMLRAKFTDLTRELRTNLMTPPENASETIAGGQPSFQRMKKNWLPAGVSHR